MQDGKLTSRYKEHQGIPVLGENMPDSHLIRELDAMIADSDRDNNYFPASGGGRMDDRRLGRQHGPWTGD